MDVNDWDERYRADDLVWGVEPNQFVRQLCERLPVGRALDLACGEGRNAWWLARLGWRVTATDYSSVAIERARALGARESAALAGRISWVIADVTSTLPRPFSADLAVISYLHLPPAQRNTVVRSAARAIRAGGHLILVGHDARNLSEGVGGPQDATLLYDPAELTEVLRDTGVVIELAETAERRTDEGVALDTVLRARRPRDD
ncbi:MAG: class I SAM-dependent methyltransferase [Nocardioidaceae bacterium]